METFPILQLLSLLLLHLFFISSLSLQALAPPSSTANVASLTFGHGETEETEEKPELHYKHSPHTSTPVSLPRHDPSGTHFSPTPELNQQREEGDTSLLPISHAVNPTLTPTLVWFILTLVAIVFFILSLPAFGYLTATFLQAENTLTTLDYLPLLAPSATILLSSIFFSIFASLFVRSLGKYKQAKLQYTYSPRLSKSYITPIKVMEYYYNLENFPDSQLEILSHILMNSNTTNDFYDFFLKNYKKDDFNSFLIETLPQDTNHYDPNAIQSYCEKIIAFSSSKPTKAMTLFRSAILPATYHLNSIKTKQYTPITVDPEQVETFAADLAQYTKNTLNPLLAPLYPTTTTNKTVIIQPVPELRHNGKLVLATNQPQTDGSINIKVSYAFYQLYSSLQKQNPTTAETFKLFILANELHQALYQISTQSQTTTLSNDEIEYLSMIASLQTLCSLPSLHGQTLNPANLIAMLKSLLDNSLVPTHPGESPKLSTQELELVKHIEKHLGIIHQLQPTPPCSLLDAKTTLHSQGIADSLATAVHLTSIVLSSS